MTSRFALISAVAAIFLPIAIRGQGDGGTQEIAFSAGLTHHQSLTPHQKVVFDRLFTNIGAGYSTSTGIFTCPQSGIYVFTVHALARSGESMYLELYHNYKYMLSVWGHTDNDYAAGGNAIMLQLTKGDEVYIVGGDNGEVGVELYGDPSEIYGTFSGYLVNPVFDEFPVGK